MNIRYKQSAGLLMFRESGGVLQVLLVHPGGPFWANKDLGAWSLPKGEHGSDEAAEAAALREFEEETGMRPDLDRLIPLGETTQKSGKVVRAWAFRGDCEPATIRSNMFSLEWPPRSGQLKEFPEVDRAGWFAIADARERLNPAQVVFLERLEAELR